MYPICLRILLLYNRFQGICGYKSCIHLVHSKDDQAASAQTPRNMNAIAMGIQKHSSSIHFACFFLRFFPIR